MPQAGRPVASLITFGRYEYRHIYRNVDLTKPQSALAKDIDRLSRLNRVDAAPIGLLDSGDYLFLTQVKGRRTFHTPVTDLLMNLDAAGQGQLIDLLADRAKRGTEIGAARG